MIAYRGVPSVDEVELHTDLIANSLGNACWIKDVAEVYARVQRPCGTTTIQIQDGSYIVVEN